MFKLVRAESTVSGALEARHQWPLRITATNTNDDTPAYVFVMQVAAPAASDLGDDFSCVASVQQLTELPISAPVPGVAYYRVNSVTIMCRNPDLAVEAWEKIKWAVQDLANNLAASAVLVNVETAVIIPEP